MTDRKIESGPAPDSGVLDRYFVRLTIIPFSQNCSQHRSTQYLKMCLGSYGHYSYPDMVRLHPGLSGRRLPTIVPFCKFTVLDHHVRLRAVPTTTRKAYNM